MNATLRNCLLHLHRWTGLSLGLVLIVIAVTGAIVLFRPQLEPVVNRDLLTVPACTERSSIETLTANARAAHKESQLDYIRMNRPEDGAARIPATRIRFTDQVFVFLNPCTGEVLGERPRYGGVLATMEQTHIFRFGPERSLITPISAIIFAIVLITGGVALWWPSRGRRFRDALRSPTRIPAGPARKLQLHKVAGVFAGLVLVSLVLTGLPLSFDWYRDGLYAMTGSPRPSKFPPSKLPATGEARRVPLDTIWEKAQNLVPNWNEVLIHYPEKPKAPYDMYLIERDAPHPNARTMLFFDAYSGEVLRHTPYPQSSAGHKLYFWSISFHTGQFGDWPVQLVLLAGVLCVPLLAFTGTMSWLQRRNAAAARRRAVAEQAGQTS